MKNDEKGFIENQPDGNSLIEGLNRRIEIANGDPMEYIQRFNRHTLNVSLMDEQANKQLWEGVEITFYNEDNAINHLSFVGDFLEVLTKEENRMWGTGMADEALVERLTSFVRKRVSPPEGYDPNGDNLVSLTEVVGKLKQQQEEEEI